MPEESPSPHGSNRERSLLIQSVGYAVAVIAGAWGLIQIILFADPFFAVNLRYAVFLGLVVLLLPVPVLLLAILARRRAARDQAGRFSRGILRLDDWLRRNFRPPVGPAVIIGTLFAIFVGIGRVQTISERDIAKEELRSMGLLFSMDSLQHALYFVDDRSAMLFRRAGVPAEDIYRVLGEPYDFTGQDPLLIGIFEKLDEESDVGEEAPSGPHGQTYEDACHDLVDGRVETTTYDSSRLCANLADWLSAKRQDEDQVLAEQLVNLLAESPSGGSLIARYLDSHPPAQDRPALQILHSYLSDRLVATNGQETLANAFTLSYGPDAEEGAGGPRSLLSYALEHPSPYVAAALLEKGAPLPGTVPLLHPLPEEPSEAQAAVLIDPLLPLVQSDDDALSRKEIVHLAEVLCATESREGPKKPLAVRPLRLTQYRYAEQYSTRLAGTSCVQQTDEPAGSNHPMLSPALDLAGVVVRRNAEGCSIIKARLEQPAATQPGITSREGTGDYADGSLDVVLQHMQHDGEDHVRLAVNEDRLHVSGWMPASATAVTLTESLVPYVVSLRPRDGAADTSNCDPSHPELWISVTETTTMPLPISFTDTNLTTRKCLRAGQRTGVELKYEAPDTDLCIQAVAVVDSVGDGAQDAAPRSLASRYVSAGSSGVLQIPLEERGQLIQVELARADSGPLDLSLTVRPRDFLSCALVETPIVQGLAPPWSKDLRYEGTIAPEEKLRCVVEDIVSREVSLRLSGMTDDLDLNLVQLDGDSLSEQTIASSQNGNTEEELIRALLWEGRYAIDVTSLAEQVSPFTLSINKSAAVDLNDEGAGQEPSEALHLGTVSPADPVVERSGLIDANQEEDYYSVEVDESVLLDIQLGDLISDVDLELLNDRGTVIESSSELDLESERTRKVVGPGLYRVRIFMYQPGTLSKYSLRIEAREIVYLDPLSPRELKLVELDSFAANQEETLFAIDLTDFPDPARLWIAETGGREIFELELQNEQGEIIGSTSDFFAEDGQILAEAPNGRYYIRLFRNDTSQESDYRLEVKAE